jgi:hypothetical protein
MASCHSGIIRGPLADHRLEGKFLAAVTNSITARGPDLDLKIKDMNQTDWGWFFLFNRART